MLAYLDLILDVGVPWVEKLEAIGKQYEHENDADHNERTQVFLNASSRFLGWMASGVVHRIFKDSAHEEMLRNFMEIVTERSEAQIERLRLAVEMRRSEVLRDSFPIRGVSDGPDTLQ